MQLNAVDRNLALIKVILSHAVFKDSLSLYLRQQEVPSVDQVVGIMAKAKLQITESTLGRRAQTVIGWLKWIMDLTRSG